MKTSILYARSFLRETTPGTQKVVLSTASLRWLNHHLPPCLTTPALLLLLLLEIRHNVANPLAPGWQETLKPAGWFFLSSCRQSLTPCMTPLLPGIFPPTKSSLSSSSIPTFLVPKFLTAGGQALPCGSLDLPLQFGSLYFIWKFHLAPDVLLI